MLSSRFANKDASCAPQQILFITKYTCAIFFATGREVNQVQKVSDKLCAKNASQREINDEHARRTTCAHTW